MRTATDTKLSDGLSVKSRDESGSETIGNVLLSKKKSFIFLFSGIYEIHSH